MNSPKQSRKAVARSYASATSRAVTQQQAQRSPLQQLVAGSARVQGAVQRQALAATRGGRSLSAVQRKASQAGVVQCTAKIEKAEHKAIYEGYQIMDTNGNISFMDGDVVHSGATRLEPIGMSAATSLTSKGVYAIDDVTEELFWVTPDMVNAYWEHDKPDTKNVSNANLGSYPTTHYTRVAEPDERANCGGHACGQGGWMDENDIGLSDTDRYRKVDASATGAGLPVGDYILHAGYHFIRIRKTSADSFTTSEKNGSSATYERTWNEAGVRELWTRKYLNSTLYKIL